MPTKERYQKLGTKLCECGVTYHLSHKSEHNKTDRHIYATSGKLPKKCFDIEEKSNYYRIQVHRQDVIIDIKKTFCNDTKKQRAFDKIKAEQARLIAQYC